jgi:hypothetical protein
MKLFGSFAFAITVACMVGCGGGGSSSGGDAGGNSCRPTGASDACDSCDMSMCSTEFSGAFGTGITSSSTGGACRAYVTCVIGCGCTSNCAISTCGAQLTADCQNALTALDTCSKTKCASQCAKADAGMSMMPDSGLATGGCTALTACCNASTFPAQGKTSCLQQAAGGNDSVCNGLLNSFRGQGFCP